MSPWIMGCLGIVLSAVLYGFSLSEVSVPDDPPTEGIKDFLYILQGDLVTIFDIANNDFDLVIMDYAKYGDQKSEYSAEDIGVTKKGGNSGCGKVILAYLSIGEAEDYRYYWRDEWTTDPPVWLDEENPNWPGNYKVRYWEEGWQANIFGGDSSYLKRILDAGFDGVYLDIIDAFEYFEDR